MATATPELPPLPDPRQPIIDPRTGLIDPRWYEWMKFLERIVRGLRTEIP